MCEDPPRVQAAKARCPSRTKWADLLLRVFEIEALRCPWYGGERERTALLTDGVVVCKILAHLGIDTEPPRLVLARAPPEHDFTI